MEKERPTLYEIKENEPSITYRIFYSAHETEEDLAKLSEELKTKLDVYVPEISGWNEEARTIYAGIAAGNINPEKLRADMEHSDPSRFEELKALYNTGVKVLFADIPSNNDIETENNIIMQNFGSVYTLFYSGYYKPAINKLNKLAKAFIDNQAKREAYIEKQLEIGVKQLIDSDEQLKHKNNITVLMRLGALHTSIYHSLKKRPADISAGAKVQAERIFDTSDGIYFYSLFDQLLRKYRFGKKVEEEDLARALIQLMIEKDINNFVPVTRTATKYEVTRKLLRNIKPEDAQRLCQSAAKSTDLVSELAKMGIRIPKTETEVTQLLSH
jgi:hypothetical protein